MPTELTFEIERVRTALHESGHAVAAVLFGVEFLFVTNGIGSSDSHIEYSPSSPLHEKAIMAMAGAVVEKRARGGGDLRAEIMSSSDRVVVYRVADALGRDRERYFRDVATVTEDVMGDPAVMRAVSAVAGELLKRTRLNFGEVKTIVSRFIRS